MVLFKFIIINDHGTVINPCNRRDTVLKCRTIMLSDEILKQGQNRPWLLIHKWLKHIFAIKKNSVLKGLRIQCFLFFWLKSWFRAILIEQSPNRSDFFWFKFGSVRSNLDFIYLSTKVSKFQCIQVSRLCRKIIYPMYK